MASSHTQVVNQKQNFDFLVKVEGNCLKLQSKVLTNLVASYGDNAKLPVAVISVIGQQKSKKTFLNNILKHEFEELADKCSSLFGIEDKFPIDSEQSQVNELSLHDQNGIIICTKPMVIHPLRGAPFAVLFLDIWSKTASPTEYQKLVDFCFSASSVLILSEIRSNPSGFLWKTPKSDQNQVEKGNLQQLLTSVVIHGKYENKEGEDGNFNHSSQFRGIIDTAKSLNPNPESWYSLSIPKKTVAYGEYCSCPEYKTELRKFVFTTVADTMDIFKQIPTEKSCSVSSLHQSLNEIVETMNTVAETNISKSNENKCNNPEAKNGAFSSQNDEKAKIEKPISPGQGDQSTDAVTNTVERLKSEEKSAAKFVTEAGKGTQTLARNKNQNKTDQTMEVDGEKFESKASTRSSEENTNLKQASKVPYEGKHNVKTQLSKTSHKTVAESESSDKFLPASVTRSSGALGGKNSSDLKVKEAKTSSEVNEKQKYNFSTEASFSESRKVPQSNNDLKLGKNQMKEGGFKIPAPISNEGIGSEGESETNNSVKASTRSKPQVGSEIGEKPVKTDALNSKESTNLKQTSQKFFDLPEGNHERTEQRSTTGNKTAVQPESNWKTLAASSTKEIESFQDQPANQQRPSENVKSQTNNTSNNDKQYVQSKKDQDKLINKAVELYKDRLNSYTKAMATELFIDPQKLKAQHAFIKAEVFEYLNQNLIKPTEKVLQSVEMQFNKIFDEVYAKNLNEEACFKIYLQNVSAIFDSKLNEEIANLEQELRKEPCKFHIDTRMQQQKFDKHRKNFTSGIAGKWKPHFNDWFSSKTVDYFSDLNKMQRRQNSYSESMKAYWKSFFCFETNQIEGIHQECIEGLDTGKTTHAWKYDKLRDFANLAIELIHIHWIQQNSKAIKWEEKAMRMALEFAENAYNEFMKSKIKVAMYTNKQVKTLHEIGIISILQNFDRLPKFNYSFVWMNLSEQITRTLQPMQEHYMKLNQDKLRAHTSLQELLSKCEKLYGDKMLSHMPSTKVTDQFMDLYHMKAKKAAIEHLGDSKVSNLGKDIKNELANKLDILRRSWEDENEKKPGKEVEIPADLSVKETKGVTSATGKGPYGVGMYFSPDVVRLEIYKEGAKQHSILEWPPTIDFPGKDIKFFLKREAWGTCFNVYTLLSERQYKPKALYINSNRMTLFCEEIVAIFLNKIKSEAENKFQVEIKSCVVATSAFMNTTGKQMLKSALFIAGFERSRLIQSTTAIGLSYIIQNRERENQSLAIVYNGISAFDVAITKVHHNSICIHQITGTPYIEKPVQGSRFNPLNYLASKPDPNACKLKLLENTLKELTRKQPNTVLLVVSGENDELLPDIRKMQLSDLVKRKFSNEIRLTCGAAALDASLSHSVGGSSLQYTEAFPYTLKAQYENESFRIVHNTPIIDRYLNCYFQLRENQYWHRVYISEEEYFPINEFKVDLEVTKFNKYLYLINFNLEGLLESVECKSADGTKTVPLQVTQKLLNRQQQLEAIEKVGFILIPPKTFSKSEQVECAPPTREPGKEEMKEKLRSFIEEVKIKIDKTTTTSSKIVDRCRERIRQAEEVLGNPEAKEKVLQVEYGKLEVWAGKINED